VLKKGRCWVWNQVSISSQVCGFGEEEREEGGDEGTGGGGGQEKDAQRRMGAGVGEGGRMGEIGTVS
jgi:hypothetical protein